MRLFALNEDIDRERSIVHKGELKARRRTSTQHLSNAFYKLIHHHSDCKYLISLLFLSPSLSFSLLPLPHTYVLVYMMYGNTSSNKEEFSTQFIAVNTISVWTIVFCSPYFADTHDC